MWPQWLSTCLVAQSLVPPQCSQGLGRGGAAQNEARLPEREAGKWDGCVDAEIMVVILETFLIDIQQFVHCSKICIIQE